MLSWYFSYIFKWNSIIIFKKRLYQLLLAPYPFETSYIDNLFAAEIKIDIRSRFTCLEPGWRANQGIRTKRRRDEGCRIGGGCAAGKILNSFRISYLDCTRDRKLSTTPSIINVYPGGFNWSSSPFDYRDPIFHIPSYPFSPAISLTPFSAALIWPLSA